MTDPAGSEARPQDEQSSQDPGGDASGTAPLTTDPEAQHDQNPAADPGTEAS
jgi:hypothetical protein